MCNVSNSYYVKSIFAYQSICKINKKATCNVQKASIYVVKVTLLLFKRQICRYRNNWVCCIIVYYIILHRETSNNKNTTQL